MKILTKEILKSFSYTTATGNREGTAIVRINGRNYVKMGTLQAVTLVGDLCEVYDADVKLKKKVLFVGVARQHPCDRKIDKELAYEVAHLNALMNPQMIIEVGSEFTKYNFKVFAENYIDTLKLEFIKTTEEIEEETLLSAIDDIAKCYESEEDDKYIDEV